MSLADHGREGPTVPLETAEELYEHAPCGYLSTLWDGTIVRVNATLESWLGYPREQLLGRRFVELLTAGGRIYHETHYAPLLAMQGRVREIALELVRADGSRLPVLINSIVAASSDGAVRTIRTSVLDATQRREYERELLRARERAERSEARARVLARTLQASLIPPTPPAIPGLDVAAAYRPAGQGDEVGGDFYDVFEMRRRDWAVVIGDVCGKGAEAATVTALARYTVRAAAMRTARPAAVLAQLNEALLRHADERFCTVLFVRVRPDPSGRVRVTITSGGHPLPILCSAGGVAPVGVPGTVLGVIPAPELAEIDVELEAGDALVCFTDGIVEGRGRAGFYGSERLVAVLTRERGVIAEGTAPFPAPRPGGASPPDNGAAALTDALVDDVVAFSGGTTRDDIAVVTMIVPSLDRGG